MLEEVSKDVLSKYNFEWPFTDEIHKNSDNDGRETLKSKSMTTTVWLQEQSTVIEAFFHNTNEMKNIANHSQVYSNQRQNKKSILVVQML